MPTITNYWHQPLITSGKKSTGKKLHSYPIKWSSRKPRFYWILIIFKVLKLAISDQKASIKKCSDFNLWIFCFSPCTCHSQSTWYVPQNPAKHCPASSLYKLFLVHEGSLKLNWFLQSKTWNEISILKYTSKNLDRSLPTKSFSSEKWKHSFFSLHLFRPWHHIAPKPGIGWEDPWNILNQKRGKVNICFLSQGCLKPP